MTSPQMSIARKTPRDSFEIAKRKLSVKSRMSDTPFPVPPPSQNSSAALVTRTSGTDECPCADGPNERKLLLEAAASIASELLKHIRSTDRSNDWKTGSSALENPCVHCGGTRPCGPGCSCPCHGHTATKPCQEALKERAEKEFAKNEPLPEPIDPETVTECKPIQLRAGKILTLCDCTKRNGLQNQCRRLGCSEKCPRFRPKHRSLLEVGDAIPTVDSTPRCCAGKMQAEMYRKMEATIDGLMLKSRSRRHCEPEEKPPSFSPPPPFNWTGIYPHVCRNPKDACKKIRQNFEMPPCHTGCKHWTVPRPCTYPNCRANCFEDPPPKAPAADIAALTLTITPLKEEIC